MSKMMNERRKGTLIITITHLDNTEEQFNATLEPDASDIEDWNAAWKKFDVSTEPDTWINKAEHQKISFSDIEKIITDFLEYDIWQYEKTIIKHEFKGKGK